MHPATSEDGRVFPFCSSTMIRRWHEAREQAGFPGLRFHSLRKTFLTLARRRGVQLEVAMALSDHRDVRVALQVYRAVDDEELLRAVGRLPT